MGEIIKAGIADKATTKPAKEGESDFSKINHGIEMVTIALLTPDEKLDNWSKKTLIT